MALPVFAVVFLADAAAGLAASGFGAGAGFAACVLGPDVAALADWAVPEGAPALVFVELVVALAMAELPGFGQTGCPCVTIGVPRCDAANQPQMSLRCRESRYSAGSSAPVFART